MAWKTQKFQMTGTSLFLWPMIMAITCRGDCKKFSARRRQSPGKWGPKNYNPTFKINEETGIPYKRNLL